MTGKEEKHGEMFTAILKDHQGNAEKFFNTMLDFMEKNTVFGLYENHQAKKLLTDAVKRHFDLKKELEPKSANDSFDEMPEPDINAFNTSDVPARSKEARKKLIGFSCDDCEKYYRHLDISEQELEEAKQACSRHRATSAPPQNSPKELWKTEMSPDKEKPIIYEELLTREKRREMRKNRPKIAKDEPFVSIVKPFGKKYPKENKPTFINPKLSKF